MNNAGVPIAFLALAIWAASVMLGAPAPVCEPPKPAPVAAPYQAPESLTVANNRPTVVIVADLASEFGARWLAEDADKLRAKGWEVRAVDVQGLAETRFYVNANGGWQIHAGQMSLSGLKAMLAR